MAGPSGSDRRDGFPLRRSGQAGHDRLVTEDEAKAVAEFRRQASSIQRLTDRATQTRPGQSLDKIIFNKSDVHP
jgi:hypothetical protein